MRVSQALLAVPVSLAAIAAPASAQVAPGPNVTVTFAESATETETSNGAPTIRGWTNIFASGGNPSTAALLLFFPQAPQPFSFTYSLLDSDGEVSDQVTFSGGQGTGVAAQTLTITFLSDPASFAGTVYGSTGETGASQPIPLPPNLPQSGNTLSVSAQSDLEGVPEPESWAMMVAGFGFAGLVLRRRRNFTERFAQVV